MNVTIKGQLYEGKAKQVFETSDPNIVMVHYKDDATAGDGEKKGTIRDKGIVNNKLSNALMQKLEKEGIPTHYVKELNDRDTLVKKVEIVPLEVIIRNVAAGHFTLRMGVPELGSLYLGGADPVVLARAGRITKASDEAAVRARGLLALERAPYAPNDF